MQIIYHFLNWDWSNSLNDRYVYTDNQIMIHLFTKIKKRDLFRTQAASHIYFKYDKKKYLKINKIFKSK